jgi:hypothetical protein
MPIFFRLEDRSGAAFDPLEQQQLVEGRESLIDAPVSSALAHRSTEKFGWLAALFLLDYNPLNEWSGTGRFPVSYLWFRTDSKYVI